MKPMIIKPQSGWMPIKLREWVEFIDLYLILIQRDIKVRYKQTALGIAWVVIQPLVTSFLIGLLFGKLAKFPSDGIPYILFVLGGMLPWTFFAQSVQRSSQSIVNEAPLISKVYFPRAMIPASICAANFIDFSINLATIFVLILIYGIPLSLGLFLLPLLMILLFLFAFGLGLFFSALSAFYRDFNYILPFLLQMWMYASPLLYSVAIVPENCKFIYICNPLAGIISGFRWALFRAGPFPAESIGIAAFISVVVFTIGAFVFYRVERQFVDVI